MRHLPKHILPLLLCCCAVMFPAVASAPAVQAREDAKASQALPGAGNEAGVPADTTRNWREQERLTAKYRQMHGAMRRPGIAFQVSLPAAEGNVPHQQERLQ